MNVHHRAKKEPDVPGWEKVQIGFPPSEVSGSSRVEVEMTEQESVDSRVERLHWLVEEA